MVDNNIFQSDEFKITITILGGISFIILLFFLLWKFGLIWNYSDLVSNISEPVYTETGIGTQPVVNPSALLGTCGESTCQGINFQEGWAWCNKCGAIFNYNSPYRNCYAGGLHNRSGSKKYKISTNYIPSCNSQSGWKMCSRCSTLVNSRTTSRCFDKASHNLSGSIQYYVCSNNVHRQCNWRWCKKCNSLFYAPSSSVCWDGEQHDYSSSDQYQLNIYEEKTPWLNYPMIFGDSCKNIGTYTLTLPECQTLCDKTKGCTAINFTTQSKNCDLRQCSIGTQPTWYYQGQFGYAHYVV